MASLRLLIPRKHSPWVVLDNLIVDWAAWLAVGRPGVISGGLGIALGGLLCVLGCLGVARVGPEVVCGSLRGVMGNLGVALGSLGLPG